MTPPTDEAGSAMPTEDDARRVVVAALGKAPERIERFTTGTHHYVYDVTVAGHAPVVVRMATPSERPAMAGALHLSRQLRPLGVPLPTVIAADVEAAFPWMLLERLPGRDLGHVMRQLPDTALDGIARGVAAAQAVTSALPTAGRFGYAVHAADAPHAVWSSVPEANLARSRQRIAASGLFDLKHLEAAARILEGMRSELDAMPATAFLHDTTTKNVIVTPDGRLSGIVDVDDLCFGDPRYAPALTLAAMMAHEGPRQYVEFWQRHGGWHDDRVFRFYVAMFLLDLMGEQGHALNGNDTATSAQWRTRLENAFVAAVSAL